MLSRLCGTGVKTIRICSKKLIFEKKFTIIARNYSIMLPAQLKFNLTVEEIHATADKIIEKTKAVHDQVGQVDLNNVNWDNTIGQLLAVDEEHNALAASCYFPMYMHGESTVRDASGEANSKIEKAEVELSGRKDVYLRLKKLFENEQSKLDALDTRLLKKTLRDYERQGVDLPKDKFDRLQEIRKRLSDLSIQFQKALNEENSKWPFSTDELKGMPDDFIKNLPETDDGKKELTLKYTDLFPILQHCEVPNTRAVMDNANSNKCKGNVQLIEEALTLRREAANLLGFDSHASFVLEERMAKKPETVRSFLADLVEKLTPKAVQEQSDLLSIKKSFCETNNLPFENTLKHSEWRFYQNLRLKNEFAVDNNAIKQYFPMSKVTNELLALYQDLFGLHFREVAPTDADYRVWHKDVRQFEVSDRESKDALGVFYLDLHPREGKYGHAAVFPLIPTRKNAAGERQCVVAAMLANFTKPTSDRESLLFHNEVVTYFHEFGHVVHSLCSQSKYSRFAGTSVERDFVEAPSQMLENWCWNKLVLQKITSHFETKKVLPDDLIDKMLAAKNADTGLFNKRQLFFGTLDQTIHGVEPVNNTSELWNSLWTQFTGIEAPDGHPLASFGHLMGGYEASYYGYMWSEVFSSDMFGLFADPFDFDLGKRYRRCILEPGFTRDSDESLRQFLGREPNNEAFLKHIGL